MTKIAVEQAVAVVRSATTAEEVQAVLEQCTKDQLHEVFLAVTGNAEEKAPKSWKKAELVKTYTARTIAYKAREAFKVMDTKARAEYLMSQKYEQDNNCVDALIRVISLHDLIALNMALGVSFGEYQAEVNSEDDRTTSLKFILGSFIRQVVFEAKLAASKPETEAEAAFRQWEENFKGKDDFAFGATGNYLKLLDTIAGSKEVVAEEVDTYFPHWYIESGRSNVEFRQALFQTDPRKVVKFLAVSEFQDMEDQLNALRVATGLATVECTSWKEMTFKRKLSRLVASLETEQEVKSDEVKPDEAKPDYDAAFDESAYSPDVQEVRVIVDDIPERHTPDIQEVSTTEYEAMREAYEEYLDAEDKYLISHKTDTAEKEKSDEAYRRYLMLLGKYRRGSMPEREKALNWVRERCGKAFLPVDTLKRNYSFDELAEISHKCGIHMAFFKGYYSKQDMAVMLIREAGIEDSTKTSYESAMEQRKELQCCIHKLWQKRHALRKAQRMFGEGSADAEALSDVWDQYQDEVNILLGEYWKVCETLEDLRSRERSYEADVKLAEELSKPQKVEAEVREVPTVEGVPTNKPQGTHRRKKKGVKGSRKSHGASWLQCAQLTSKPRKCSPNPKPLLKATRAALMVRVRKY